jgi:hypothetical protein
VVVRGDPPTGRGQLAALPKPEGISPLKIQLLNRPRKRVTPNVLQDEASAAQSVSGLPMFGERFPS